MRLSGESANLEFDTDNIRFNANTTTDIFIFQQINLRVALGSMYNKYNKFYMVFNSIASFNGSLPTYSAGDVSGVTTVTGWLIGVSGLDFINNSVDGVISKTALFPLTFPLALNGYKDGGDSLTSNGVVFNKPSNDIQDIAIQPYLVRGLQPCKVVNSSGSTQIGDYNFSFTVYGLE